MSNFNHIINLNYIYMFGWKVNIWNKIILLKINTLLNLTKMYEDQ